MVELADVALDVWVVEALVRVGVLEAVVPLDVDGLVLAVLDAVLDAAATVAPCDVVALGYS